MNPKAIAIRSVNAAYTAKRLRPEAQGCFNPGIFDVSDHINPERVATLDATALR